MDEKTKVLDCRSSRCLVENDLCTGYSYLLPDCFKNHKSCTDRFYTNDLTRIKYIRRYSLCSGPCRSGFAWMHDAPSYKASCLSCTYTTLIFKLRDDGEIFIIVQKQLIKHETASSTTRRQYTYNEHHHAASNHDEAVRGRFYPRNRRQLYNRHRVLVFHITNDRRHSTTREWSDTYIYANPSSYTLPAFFSMSIFR
jgi:hypothetical protein